MGTPGLCSCSMADRKASWTGGSKGASLVHTNHKDGRLSARAVLQSVTAQREGSVAETRRRNDLLRVLTLATIPKCQGDDEEDGNTGAKD